MQTESLYGLYVSFDTDEHEKYTDIKGMLEKSLKQASILAAQNKNAELAAHSVIINNDIELTVCINKGKLQLGIITNDNLLDHCDFSQIEQINQRECNTIKIRADAIANPNKSKNLYNKRLNNLWENHLRQLERDKQTEVDDDRYMKPLTGYETLDELIAFAKKAYERQNSQPQQQKQKGNINRDDFLR